MKKYIWLFIAFLILHTSYIEINTISASNISSTNNVEVPYKETLDTFLNKVISLKNNSHFSNTLDKLLEQLTILENKYKSHGQITQMITYLQTGVKQIKQEYEQNNDLEAFFCELIENCENAQKSTTQTNTPTSNTLKVWAPSEDTSWKTSNSTTPNEVYECKTRNVEQWVMADSNSSHREIYQVKNSSECASKCEWLQSKSWSINYVDGLWYYNCMCWNLELKKIWGTSYSWANCTLKKENPPSNYISKYPLCNENDIIIWNSIISSCNVWSTKAWLTEESYWDYYQRGKYNNDWTQENDNPTNKWWENFQWPCLPGYHIPSSHEIEDLFISLWVINNKWAVDVSKLDFIVQTLKLPLAGTQNSMNTDALHTAAWNWWVYHIQNGYDLSFWSNGFNYRSSVWSIFGKTVRCFKDNYEKSILDDFWVKWSLWENGNGAVIKWCGTYAIADKNGNYSLNNISKNTYCWEIQIEKKWYNCKNIDLNSIITQNKTSINSQCSQNYYPWSGWAGKCDTPDIVLSNWQVWAGCNVWASISKEVWNYYQWGSKKEGWEKNYTSQDKIWGKNEICASGYSIPSQKEWSQAYDSTRALDTANNNWQGSHLSKILWLPFGWYRYFDDGSLQWLWKNGSYWSSDSEKYFFFNGWNDIVNPNMSQWNWYAIPIRCIKN